ncbi:putative ankycorbin, partial [Apostichopus japonicus]
MDGFAEVVKLLLLNGASSAVLGEDGSLYQCEQFEGVQAVIENHRKSRTDDMMLSIKDKKRFNYLQKHWQIMAFGAAPMDRHVVLALSPNCDVTHVIFSRDSHVITFISVKEYNFRGCQSLTTIFGIVSEPLMSSCLAGRVPVVKFLLQTAIQDLGDVTVDFEKSMRLRYNSQSDSRNFLESYASTYQGGQS